MGPSWEEYLVVASEKLNDFFDELDLTFDAMGVDGPVIFGS